mgnify:CR=1 FL=1
MRKLMMGCIPGMRTLVNTTEPHYSPELMNTPITLTVGASYSISWTGAKPTTSSHYIYPFCIYVYGGASGFFDMCDVRIKKVDSSGISIVSKMFGTDIINTQFGLGAGINTLNLEIRFTVTDVTEKDGITVYTVTAGIYMYGNKIMEKSDIKNTMDIGDGLKYYYNLEGTFVIKKLS